MENKWWEYYAVRYFVGTVVGALVVAFLNLEPGSPFEDRLAILGDSKEVTFLGVGLVAALGFAFCYIASSPVLTLHATRAHLRFSAIRASPFAFASALLVPMLLAILAFWQFLPPVAAASSGLVIGVESGLVLLAIFTKFGVVENFYRDLATARSKGMPEKDKPPTPGIEYVTSYRHLREHGNAFLIVLLEGLLAYTLFHSPSRGCAMIILAFWLLPSATVWLFGTVLESRLVSKALP
ncbi:MAG: hypothetical protein IT469_02100 [Pseudomonadales bacterium]|nr:hypothetical protein [Pseudomonadales bacterium]